MAQPVPALPPARGGPAAGMPPCSICGQLPMRAPYEAACGHLACYACWLGALAKFKCPTCAKPLRKAALLPKQFA